LTAAETDIRTLLQMKNDLVGLLWCSVEKVGGMMKLTREDRIKFDHRYSLIDVRIDPASDEMVVTARTVHPTGLVNANGQDIVEEGAPTEPPKEGA
jgi:hypothetical protein